MNEESNPSVQEAMNSDRLRFETGSTAWPTRGSSQNPVSLRELIAVLLLIVVADITIYRGHGYAGYAVLFLAAPALLWHGAFRPHTGMGMRLTGILLTLLAVKLVWCGSSLLVALGFFLLVAFAMSLSGLCPYVLEVLVFASQTVLAGYTGLSQYGRSLRSMSPAIIRVPWLNLMLPIATFLVFGLLFVLANPDLLTAFGQQIEVWMRQLRQWLAEFAPSPAELLFLGVVAWLSVGLLRPVIKPSPYAELFSDEPPWGGGAEKPSLLYAAFRNTLLTVNVLFAAYLVYEFQTLWFRVFPPGFYYSGYAHQGAAWLTLALALATLMLSLVFRGEILQDPRVARLRGLALVWSLENLLLAVAVYHRLYIYIGFNGMTRMRMVGLFGMSTVVIGFLLVLWKISRNRGFTWLLRRHLWALGLAVYLFALTPVDTFVVAYNVQRILRGDPAPSVQISVHPISAEGVLLLQPLLNCRNATIREGVRALLAKRHEEAETLAAERQNLGWTAVQLAEDLAHRGLRAASGNWNQYRDPARRDAALERFHSYAYQWY